jgi:hypothetical protein
MCCVQQDHGIPVRQRHRTRQICQRQSRICRQLLRPGHRLLPRPLFQQLHAGLAIGQSFEAEADWANVFAPSGDVVRLLLLAIYESNGHPFLLIPSIPGGLDGALCSATIIHATALPVRSSGRPSISPTKPTLDTTLPPTAPTSASSALTPARTRFRT